MASVWTLSVLLANAAAAAGSGEAAGTTAPASPLSLLPSPAANGLLSGAAQVVGNAVDGGAATVGAIPVGPVLTPVTSTVQPVGSSVVRSVPAVPPGLGVTPGTVGTFTTTVAGSPAESPSPAGAAGSIAGEPVTSERARRHAQPAPRRPVPGVPTLFSLLSTAGTTASPSHGHGSSEGMPPVSALLLLLIGGLTLLGGGRHARWLFDARGPPPG